MNRRLALCVLILCGNIVLNVSALGLTDPDDVTSTAGWLCALSFSSAAVVLWVMLPALASFRFPARRPRRKRVLWRHHV